jgi:hypothetical protein
MLFLLFGSSAAGKTYVLDALRERVPDVAVHDVDEMGVPPNADTSWRQRANAAWIERAADYQSHGVDLLLAGQTPYGELLASPSAPRLEAISACLLDCDDDVRVARLRARGPRWLEQVIIDTSQLPVEQVAAALVGWITEERASVRAGTHPLSEWAKYSEGYEHMFVTSWVRCKPLVSPGGPCYLLPQP